MRNPLDPGYYVSDELRSLGFKSVGEDVRISKACNIVGPENIEIGDHVRIDAFTSIIAVTGHLCLGSYIHIGGNCHFAVADELFFGDFSGTSQHVRIYTANDDYSGHALMGPMVPEECRNVKRAPVRIEKFAAVASGSTVLPGVTLAEGAILGAMSLATRNCKPWTIYLGCPAKRLMDRARDVIELEQIARRSHANVRNIFDRQSPEHDLARGAGGDPDIGSPIRKVPLG